MLKNNNQALIRRLAVKSLKNNRQRSAVLMLAVLLSAFMVFSVITVGITYFNMQKVQNIRLTGDDMDAILYGLTSQQRQLCENSPDVEEAGILAIAGYAISTKEDDTLDIGFCWADETYWEKIKGPAREWTKGTYPQKENEVMVTQKALEECGLDDLEIGDSFQIVYGDAMGEHTETFTISGMWDGYGQKRVFYVSEAFYRQTGNELASVSSGRYYINFNKRFMTGKEQEAFRESLQLGKQQSLFFTAQYGEAIRIVAGLAGVIFVTCLSAYLLIYNIMYLSVAGNIRYYGLLQTVGMTGRQVYRFVQRQTGIIGLVGMVGGILCGSIMSFLIVPSIAKSLSGFTKTIGGVDVVFHPAVLLLTVLVVGVTVYISGRKPAKMATAVSPVEALGYRSMAGSKHARQTGHGNVIWRMAKQQVSGDKKRYGLVILSLAASLSVFLCITTLMESQGARTLVSNYMNMDMVVKNKTLEKEDQKEWDPLLDRAFLDGLEEDAGVMEYHPMFCAEITVPWEEDFADLWMRKTYEKWVDTPYEEDIGEYKQHPENFGSVIIGIDEEEFDYLNAAFEEPVSKEDFINGNSCILYGNDLEFSPKELDGATITCALYEDRANRKTYRIAGITQERYYTGSLFGMTPTVIVSDKAIKEFVEDPYVYKVGIFYNEEYDEDTEAAMMELMQNTSQVKDLSYESKIEELKDVEKAQGNMPVVGMGIVLILALIGIMNYVNTVAGNIQGRQGELAVMESIGMTGRQRKRLFLLEGVLYTAGTLLVTLTAGLGITYFLYDRVNYRNIPFYIPLPPFAVAVAVILVICCAVPLLVYRRLEKKGSVVERIRM